MCGICGVFALDGTLHPDAKAAVRLMNAALAHRGPDGDGFFADDVAALGHRRLAIIDRAGGHQPMANEDGTLLDRLQRRDLQPSRRCGRCSKPRAIASAPSSDTETILHAYEEFGPACVDRLEGMFAFAIYDSRRRELFAARDRLGKKPFFYTTLDGVFHFASELPALARSPLWTGEVDLSALEGYLSLGYFLAPGDDLSRRATSCCPATGCASPNGTDRDRASTGTSREFDTDSRSPDALLARDRRDAPRTPCTSGSKARCRSARSSAAASTRAWSCRTWPRRSAIGWSRRRSASASARTTSSRRPA